MGQSPGWFRVFPGEGTPSMTLTVQVTFFISLLFSSLPADASSGSDQSAAQALQQRLLDGRDMENTTRFGHILSTTPSSTDAILASVSPLITRVTPPENSLVESIQCSVKIPASAKVKNSYFLFNFSHKFFFFTFPGFTDSEKLGPELSQAR